MEGVQGEDKEMKFDLSCVNESLVVNFMRSWDESAEVSEETHLQRRNFTEEDISDKGAHLKVNSATSADIRKLNVGEDSLECQYCSSQC